MRRLFTDFLCTGEAPKLDEARRLRLDDREMRRRSGRGGCLVAASHHGKFARGERLPRISASFAGLLFLKWKAWTTSSR